MIETKRTKAQKTVKWDFFPPYTKESQSAAMETVLSTEMAVCDRVCFDCRPPIPSNWKHFCEGIPFCARRHLKGEAQHKWHITVWDSSLCGTDRGSLWGLRSACLTREAWRRLGEGMGLRKGDPQSRFLSFLDLEDLKALIPGIKRKLL